MIARMIADLDVRPLREALILKFTKIVLALKRAQVMWHVN